MEVLKFIDVQGRLNRGRALEKHTLPDEIKLKRALKTESNKLDTIERYLDFLEDAKLNPMKHSLNVLNDPDEHFKQSEVMRKKSEKFSLQNRSNNGDMMLDAAEAAES